MKPSAPLALLVALAIVTASSPLDAGDLLVGSFSTGNVLRYDGTSGAFVGTFASGIPSTEGVIFGPDGNLYVASASDATAPIRRFSGSTGAPLGTVPPSGSGSGSVGLVFGPDGNLYATGFFSGSIQRFDGVTGTSLGAFVAAGSGGLANPEDLTFGPDGNLYVSTFAGSVLKYNGTTGAFMATFVPAGSGGLDKAIGIKFGPDGNLYVVSQNNASVLRYNGASGAPLGAFVTSGSGGLLRPVGLAFGADGNLYVTNVTSADSKVLRYDGTTGAFIDVFVASGSGGLAGATFLAFADESSKLWLGLRNSDDQGTQFDVRVDVFVNASLAASGITRCVAGLTRNPDKAKAIASPVAGPLSAHSGDVVAVKISARIGTNGDGTKCGGPGGSHSSASGLRLYYDSISRASRVDLGIVPNPTEASYLHSNGGICANAESAAVTDRFLDPVPPSDTLVKCKDSGALNFAGGNPWKEVGTWSETL